MPPTGCEPRHHCGRSPLLWTERGRHAATINRFATAWAKWLVQLSKELRLTAMCALKFSALDRFLGGEQEAV